MKDKHVIPTAEEWLKHFEENAYPNTPISECMIDFAKLHVEAALKKASENAESVYDSEEECFINAVEQDSILNAYPLENIK